MIIGYLLGIVILSSCYQNGLNAIKIEVPRQKPEEECVKIDSLTKLGSTDETLNNASCFEYIVASNAMPIDKLTTKIDGQNKILYIKNLKGPLINIIDGRVTNLKIKLVNSQNITGSILANQNNGTIKNVTLDGGGAIITSNKDLEKFGGLVSINQGTINNATIKNISLKCSEKTQFIGGLVGQHNGQNDKNISNSKALNVNISCSSSTSTKLQAIGGLAGKNSSNSKIESSSVDTINIKYTNKSVNVRALVGLNYGILKSNSHRNVLINSKEALTY